MRREWGSAPLDKLVDDVLDRRGVTPLKLGSDFVPTGYRVISAKLIKNGRVDLAADEPRFVDEATYRKWMRTALLADDVILTSEAPLGEAAYVQQPLEWCLGQRLFGIRTNKERLHGRFLYYALQSEKVRHDLLSRATGTTAQGIRQIELRRVHIPLPSLSEQRAIAHILGTLDDKIDLNRRTNETLEAMARALFKSWFVDFDPVRAKAEARDPGLPKPLADLFPDSPEDSELGEIPKGWRPMRWGALVTLEYGKSLDGYAGDRGACPVYGTNGKIGSHSKPLCDHPGIIIGRKGAYRGVHYCSKPFFVIDTAFYIEPMAPVELRWAYYELLRQDINNIDSGSAIPSTSREDFYNLPVMFPPFEVQKTFVKILTPCWTRQDQNDRESHTLAGLRDVLLSALLSGALRLQHGVA
jgi:type I restriction enzyme, S subunit